MEEVSPERPENQLPEDGAPTPAAAVTPETATAAMAERESFAEETGADADPAPAGELPPAPPSEAPAEAPTEDAPTEAAPAEEVPTDEAVAGEPAPETGEADISPETDVAQPIEGESLDLEGDPMAAYTAESQKRRLPPADEEKLTALLVEELKNGREGVTKVLKHLPRMPWLVAVNGVSAAWAEMKPPLRTRLLAGLAREDSEAARRVRLSLARGLFKQDQVAGLKVAVSVAKDLRDKETGAMTQKHAQIFTSVFIGRAKPWVVHLPLGELKPAEADLLVHCAVTAVFQLPHSPATQLGVLKWAAENGRLATLHAHVQGLVKKGLDRWNPRWRGALKKEVAELPTELEPTPRPEAEAAPEQAASTGRNERKRNRRGSRDGRSTGTDGASVEMGEDGEAVATEPEEGENERGDHEHDHGQDGDGEHGDREADDDEVRDEDRDEDDDREDEDDDSDEAEERQVAKPYKQRPVYESKTMPNAPQHQGQQSSRRGGQQAQHFNLHETLRQIEHHVQGLKSELQQSQSKLRQRDEEVRKAKREQKPPAPHIAGEPTPDELARLNVQLESRNVELEARINELLEDAETRAATSGAVVDEQAEPVTQLKQLLAAKLEEDFADFHALEQDAADRVVRQHYRTVLQHVFEVLQAEGIPLVVKPEEAPATGGH